MPRRQSYHTAKRSPALLLHQTTTNVKNIFCSVNRCGRRCGQGAGGVQHFQPHRAALQGAQQAPGAGPVRGWRAMHNLNSSRLPRLTDSMGSLSSICAASSAVIVPSAMQPYKSNCRLWRCSLAGASDNAPHTCQSRELVR